MHGHHFSAHDVFGDFAGAIIGVTRARPARYLIRYESLVEFPGEESFAGIAGPESSVAIESGQTRRGFENSGDEFGLFGIQTGHE